MSEDSAKLYRASAQDFKKIPGNPVGYWVSQHCSEIFSSATLLENIAIPRVGMSTANNARFIRSWWEINNANFSNPSNFTPTSQYSKTWFPANNGGEFRKWYGNLLEVINWKDNGNYMKSNGNPTLRNQKYYFKEGISWTAISTTSIGVRYFNNGFLFTTAGFCIFSSNDLLLYLISFINSRVGKYFLSILSPTLNFNVGDIARLPIILQSNFVNSENIVKDCISKSKHDWDSFETSWDFQTHPFLTHKGTTLEDSYNNWEEFTAAQFAQLKSNEEELNRIFIDIYGLQDELNPEVKDEDVTIRKADLVRDVKSFISYAVGCMFGRYSIDKPGLILANAGETMADYQEKVPNSRFEIDDDNVIPVLDDNYFHDDIVSRFREFLKVVYGKETLEQNMSFIAHALSPESKATPDKVLRDYFLKDFYADHLKIYQKRPIYWMFTSGKQQGFNALIYMHRYNKDTLGKIWGDYLRELEAKLDAEISLLENAEKKNTAQLAKLKKQRLELKEYDAELDIAASAKIEIDFDDGVAVNYAKFGKLVRPLK